MQDPLRRAHLGCAPLAKFQAVKIRPPRGLPRRGPGRWLSAPAQKLGDVFFSGQDQQDLQDEWTSDSIVLILCILSDTSQEPPCVTTLTNACTKRARRRRGAREGEEPALLAANPSPDRGKPGPGRFMGVLAVAEAIGARNNLSPYLPIAEKHSI